MRKIVGPLAALALFLAQAASAQEGVPLGPNGGGGGTGGGIVGGTTTVTGTCPTGDFIFNNSGVVGCSGATSSIAFPQATTGGVSGGIPYFSSTTQLSASALLTAGSLMVGGGLANPPTTITLGGDCTFASSTITCTKTNGTAFGTLATLTPGTGVATALGDAANATGGFVTSPVANANLANSATTVNGATCTLGSTCTAAAAAGTLTGATLASGVLASSLTSVGTLTSLTVSGAVAFTLPLPVASGGTGTATPGLVAGTNITITGTWPDQTINSTGGGGSPGGTSGQIQFNNSGSFGGVTIGTGLANNSGTLNNTGALSITTTCPAAGPSTGAVTLSPPAPNFQTGTSYNIGSTAADCGGLILRINTSPITDSLVSTDFTSGGYTTVAVEASSAGDTITSSSGTINGAASIFVPPCASVGLSFNGTNWGAAISAGQCPNSTVTNLTTNYPSPSVGQPAYVTNATSCVFGATVSDAGGGGGPCPVHYTGSAWVGG